MHKKITYLFLFFQTAFFAQQIPLNTLYSYNYMQINPAEVGVKKEIEINLSHRQQWLGF